MTSFKSTYPRLSVYVGEEKVEFYSGLYSTENKEVASELRKLIPYVTEVEEDTAETVVEVVAEKPAPKKAPAKRTAKKTEPAE